ncbi:hypothetical protein CU098_004317 [Rhizopus stolonifer]|uniref:DUF7082 domain-containing protein n=1 Tax=Rhizopus stolonifer TaxID=4846 RepID=A0A367IJE1_RHIST|nr:hypothetical protein CU098_004317 [Rhizopus stolonifer]
MPQGNHKDMNSSDFIQAVPVENSPEIYSANTFSDEEKRTPEQYVTNKFNYFIPNDWKLMPLDSNLSPFKVSMGSFSKDFSSVITSIPMGLLPKAPVDSAPVNPIFQETPSDITTNDAIYAAIGKANVTFVPGCLHSAIDHWHTYEEKQSRRIMVFKAASTRANSRNPKRDILVDCIPYIGDSKETPPDCFLASCIKWRADYYVTSTDVVRILEGILSVKFQKNEKNRIRRNMECFGTLTLSQKPEVEKSIHEFYALVMGLHSPSPKSISKEIKVFSWAKLIHIVDKITKNFIPSQSSIKLAKK